MAETFLLLGPFHHFPTQNLVFGRVSDIFFEFLVERSSEACKRAYHLPFFFFLFSFLGANGYRNQSPLLGLSDFREGGLLFFFAFLGAFWGEWDKSSTAGSTGKL